MYLYTQKNGKWVPQNRLGAEETSWWADLSKAVTGGVASAAKAATSAIPQLITQATAPKPAPSTVIYGGPAGAPGQPAGNFLGVSNSTLLTVGAVVGLGGLAAWLFSGKRR